MRKFTTQLLLIACIVAWAVTPGIAGDPPATAKKTAKTDAAIEHEGVEWLNYDAGIAKAKKEGKPIVIDFYTDWCGWCKKMDKSTFQDDKVVDYLKNNFVTIRVNGESQSMVSHKGEKLSERLLTKAYGVRGFPTFWFLDSEGKQIGPAPGYKATDAFLNLLEYVGGNHYKTMSFENFVKSKSDNG